MGNDTSKSAKVSLKQKRYKYIEALLEQECDTTDAFSGQTGCEDSEDLSNIDPIDYDFPFENLVFEGGGAKGAAYWGTIKYLEDINMMPKIKRVAGASIGAIAAMFVVLGYTTSEIQNYMEEDMKEILLDTGCFDILPNLLSQFGWHRAERFEKWLGHVIGEKAGSADITFEEILRKFGRELCVVVTNVNMMRTEYCHAKTTPDMPIRLAVRMSMSIPGLFAAKKLTLHGEKDIFVDGGIVCNFPIHCFDGWYLSMANEDNFFKRLHGNMQERMSIAYENRFHQETLNMKTLGFLLFSENESEVLRTAMEEKARSVVPEKPKKDTKLYKKWVKKQMHDRKAQRVHEKLLEAANAFLKVLQKHNLDNNSIIDRKELENVVKDKSFSKTHAELLFGKEMDMSLFEVLDYNKDGQIHYTELIAFLEDSGIFLHNRYFGYKRTNIMNISSFVLGVVDTFVLNMKRVHFKPQDIARTIGINTGYVDTSDFHLEREDKEFLMDRGYNTCRSFLQRFVLDNNLQKKSVKNEETI